MSVDQSWMKRRSDDDFEDQVDEFLLFAYAHPTFVDTGKIRCPCRLCVLLHWKKRMVIKCHLFRHGFMNGYTRWTQHGETAVLPSNVAIEFEARVDSLHDYSDETMAARPHLDQDEVIALPYQKTHKMRKDKDQAHRAGEFVSEIRKNVHEEFDRVMSAHFEKAMEKWMSEHQVQDYMLPNRTSR